MPGMIRLAALHARQPHLGGAEEQRVDLVEIAVVPLEDVVERRAVVLRCRRGNLGNQLGELGVIGPDGIARLAAVQDAVVGAADRPEVVLHPDTGPRLAANRNRRVCDIREPARADLGQRAPGAEAARGVDTSVDDARAPGKLPHGYPQRRGVLRHRVGDLPRPFIEAQLSRSAHSPAHCRISPLPSSARSPEYRSYFPATYRSATGTPARPRR